MLLLLGLATLLKALWACNSIGSCDAVLFFYFAESIQKWGLAHLYETGTVFNHTPLVAALITVLFRISRGHYMAFAAGLRLICALADIPVVLGLLRLKQRTGQPAWWALGLFAASPVSLMVSGFHGNVDPVMVMFLFLAALAVAEERPVLSGLFFALACNVKIVPVILAPVFIFHWWARGRRETLRFLAVSGAGMLAGGAWGLAHCPWAFLRDIFGYGGYCGTWGIPYWLRLAGVPAFQWMSFERLNPAQVEVMAALKLIMVAGVLGMAWRRRRETGPGFFGTLGGAFVWMFVFMPGTGTQYMVWYAPFVLMASSEGFALLTAAAAVYMTTFYHSTSGFQFPWNAALPRGAEERCWGPWTNLVWGFFIAGVWRYWRAWFAIGTRMEEPGDVAEAALDAAVD